MPGPAGAAGASGSNGTDGVSAYTTTTASFIMPAEAANVTIAVVTSAPFAIGQILWIYVGGSQGHFSVVSKPTSTSLQVQNLESTASSLYTSNSAPTTVFASGAAVTPAGLQGPAGVAASAAPADAKYITQTTNATLSNEQSLGALASGMVLNTSAAGTGVLSIGLPGLDYYGPSMATDVPVTEGGTGASTAANARTNLGLAIGTNVQAYDATLLSLATLGTAADRYAYTTGVDTWVEGTLTSFARTILDDASAADVRTTLGLVTGSFALLLYEHQAADTTAGGTFTASGAFDQVVPLSTEVIDTGSNGSIAGTTITLAAGTYRYTYDVVAYSLNGIYQAVLYNTTDAAVVSESYSEVVAVLTAQTGHVIKNGRFTIAGAKAFQLRARTSATKATDGFGAAAGFAVGERYSWIRLEKE